MVVGSVIRTLTRSVLRRGGALAKVGGRYGSSIRNRLLGSSRLFRSGYSAFGRYSRLGGGVSRLNRAGATPLAHRFFRSARRYSRKGLSGLRRGIKGAYRKASLDPAGTAISAYSATRTPTLQIEPIGDFGRLFERGDLRNTGHDLGRYLSTLGYSNW